MGVIDGRVAIITGGARGIGASISRLFAREGASLVINDLGGAPDGSGGDEGPAKQIADEIAAAGGRAVADGGDIGNVATGERLVRTAVEHYGKLDIVVNVAGILRDRMIFNLPEQDWDEVIRVHLKGHYSTVRPASAPLFSSLGEYPEAAQSAASAAGWTGPPAAATGSRPAASPAAAPAAR